jgi:hypothetical protein
MFLQNWYKYYSTYANYYSYVDICQVKTVTCVIERIIVSLSYSPYFELPNRTLIHRTLASNNVHVCEIVFWSSLLFFSLIFWHFLLYHEDIYPLIKIQKVACNLFNPIHIYIYICFTDKLNYHFSDMLFFQSQFKLEKNLNKIVKNSTGQDDIWLNWSGSYKEHYYQRTIPSHVWFLRRFLNFKPIRKL